MARTTTHFEELSVFGEPFTRTIIPYSSSATAHGLSYSCCAGRSAATRFRAAFFACLGILSWCLSFLWAPLTSCWKPCKTSGMLGSVRPAL